MPMEQQSNEFPRIESEEERYVRNTVRYVKYKLGKTNVNKHKIRPHVLQEHMIKTILQIIAIETNE